MPTCSDRQLVQSQLEQGFSTRIGVQRAIRPFSGDPAPQNLVDYINRELFPAVKAGREKLNEVYRNVADQAPSANPLNYEFSKSTVNADPTVGKLRLNAATQNTATTIRVSETNAKLVSAFAWLDVMAGSATTPIGVVTLADSSDPGRFVRFDLTAMVDQGAYWDLTVTPTESSHPNPFVEGESVTIGFIPGVASGPIAINSTVGGVGIRAISAGTQLLTSGTLSFANSNGVSFGLSNSSVLTASVSPQMGLVSHVGGNSVSNVTQLAFSNASNITWSLSTAAGAVTVIASAGAGGSSVAATEGIILDPTEVLNFVRTSGTWDLETSHIDSDGTLGSTTTAAAVATTALATAPGALDRTVVECSIYCSSAGTFSVTAGGVTVLGPLSLTAAERVEFTSAQGWRVFNADGSEKTAASGGGGGGAAISAAGNSISAGTAIWSNSNNVSFGMAGSTITASATFASSQGIINFSAGTTSQNLSNVVFNNANGVSFGLNGSTITGSVNQPGLLQVVASTGTASSGTLHFTNNTLFTGDISLMTNNVVFQMIGHTAMHAHAPQRVTANLASTQTGGFLVTKLNFLNSNGVTFGVATELDAEGRAAIITASVAAGGGGLTNINVSAGTTSQNLSNVVFSNSNGVSFGLNGSTVTASVAAAGGGVTFNGFEPYADLIATTNAWIASNTMQMTINPIAMPNFTFDRVNFPCQFTLTTNTHSGTYRVNIGLYTQNASTLSLLHSTTFSTGVTISTGNTSLFQGPGYISIPWSSSVSQGNYWLGCAVGSTSAGANATMQFFLISLHATGNSRRFGAASNATVQPILGQGIHSVSSSAVPSSIAFSNIIGTATNGRRPVKFHFGSGTA